MDADSVYLDHAATTPVDPMVLAAMQPFFTERYGNPSSVHTLGRSARFAVEESRERVAAVLGCEPGEVIFTSGGTEANNAAVFGVLRDPGRRGRGLVTSAVEHESVLRTARAWAQEGNRAEILPTDASGRVSVGAVAASIGDDTGLVSLMWVNNELGTINPVEELVALCRERGVPFHTDAVQAAGLFAESIRRVAPDLLSVSAHKFGGPKGTGALVVRGGVPFRSMIVGGAQERRRRAGTENVASIVGLATALELASERAVSERERLADLQERLSTGISQRFGGAARFHTPLDGSAAPHIVNVAFHTGAEVLVDGEMLLLAMDMAGVMVSSGSACTSGAVEPSHVLRAIGVSPAAAAATIRFSMGRSTTEGAVDRALEALVETLARQGVAVA